jgi:hypothetical protein
LRKGGQREQMLDFCEAAAVADVKQQFLQNKANKILFRVILHVRFVNQYREHLEVSILQVNLFPFR